MAKPAGVEGTPALANLTSHMQNRRLHTCRIFTHAECVLSPESSNIAPGSNPLSAKLALLYQSGGARTLLSGLALGVWCNMLLSRWKCSWGTRAVLASDIRNAFRQQIGPDRIYPRICRLAQEPFLLPDPWPMSPFVSKRARIVFASRSSKLLDVRYW